MTYRARKKERRNDGKEESTSLRDGRIVRSLQDRVVYIGKYRLCISIMGNYRGGNRSSAAWYNCPAAATCEVPLSFSSCLPARLPARLLFCLSWLLSRADSRVSQLSLGSSESPVTLCVLISVESLNIKAKRKVDRSNFATWLSKPSL